MLHFLAHCYPVFTVACPTCGKAPGLWCRDPNGRRTDDPHTARQVEVDRLFVEQHGQTAAIIPGDSGWLIDPRSRARD